MGLKSFNPYTASRRFITVVDKSHITKQEPEKALLEPKKRTGGRNNHGEIVVWHRGGGHKKQYRQVDFRRDKLGVPATVFVPATVPEVKARRIAAAGAEVVKTGSVYAEAELAAREFAARVDSSAVMINASTRFNDGGQFGLGAEIGISTDKFHARGPCGLEELTSYKYVVHGNGQVRE